MSTYAIDEREPLRGGLFGAIALHVVLAAAIVAFALLGHSSQHWGEHSSETGAIQASMVSAIPLPQKAPPVDNAVLASEDVSKAPTPPPKEATQPPPRPEDVLIKAKTPEKAVVKPTPATPPRHPQPTPDSRKATTGDAATQLPQSVAQVTHGTATLTVQNRTFGDRYAYYLEIVGRTVSQNWFTQEIDPRPAGCSHWTPQRCMPCSAWTASARCPPATRSPSQTPLSTTAESSADELQAALPTLLASTM